MALTKHYKKKIIRICELVKKNKLVIIVEQNSYLIKEIVEKIGNKKTIKVSAEGVAEYGQK